MGARRTNLRHGVSPHIFSTSRIWVSTGGGNDVYVDRCPTSGGEPTRRGTSHARDAWGSNGARCFGEACRFEGDDNETPW